MLVKFLEYGLTQRRGDVTEPGHFFRELFELVLAEVTEHFARPLFADEE